MNKALIGSFASATLCALGSLHAAQVNWATSPGVLDTEVSNRGSQVFGYYFNSAGGIPSTVLVNNVPFTLQASPFAPPGLNFNGSYNHNEAGADLYQVPLTAGNMGLNQILDGQNWGAETPLTVTGLTAGQPYEVQFIISDDRMDRLNARNYDVGDSNDLEGFRDIENAYHSTRGGGVPAGKPPGSREAKILTGNFVADASGTQDIYNVLYDGTDHTGGNAGSQVNAIQVRLVAPANDNFASAQALSGFAGSVAGTTVGATRQSGEPAHDFFGSSSPTVWFQWTAPGSGSVTFDTGNATTNYDTSLAVYTGNSVTALTFIGANNDQVEGSNSLVTFNAVSGTTYRIVVLGGSSSASGTFGLDWLQQSPGGALLFNRPSLSAFESDGTVKVIVKRVGGSKGTATVAYETVERTAGPTDFVPASGVLSFEDGETSKTITVALTQDTLVEPVEEFRIRLKNATSAALGTPSEAVLSIFPNLQVPIFRGLGFFAGGSVSMAAAISGNGKVIVGSGNGSGGFTRAFRYDVPTNLMELDPTRSSSSSGAEAVSADGEVVIGTLFTTFSPRAFVWDRGGGFRELDLSGAFTGQGHGISGDGGLIVGQATDDRGSGSEHPYRWSLNSSSGKYEPEYLPNIWTDDVDENGREGLAIGAALAASQTGEIVVGQHQTKLGAQVRTEAIRFRTDDAETIGTAREAFGVSAGGETIVGQARNGNQLEAFRWTGATGVVGLGDLTGGNVDSAAKDVSADGTLVVGYGTGPSGREAILWNSSRQMRSIRQALIDAGVNMSGWVLNKATGISDDGSTIVGTGVNPAGETEAWLAVIATPPVITNGGAIGRPGGQSFTYQIQATKTPTVYGASGLPPGVHVNPATGAITGILPSTGEFTVTLTATNNAGSGSATLVLTVGEPAITSALTARRS